MERLQLVRSLIEFPQNLDDISSQLDKFCFDYDDEPVVIKKVDVMRVLELYTQGARTEEEVEKWAELLEGREDIEFDEADEDLLDEIMHKLANPYLQGKLTYSYCNELLKQHV